MVQPSPNDEFLTFEELAQMLKVNISTAKRYVKDGMFKAFKIGKGGKGAVRISKQSVLEHLEKNEL